MGIHNRRKTDFFPEEDTTISYSGFEPELTRLQAEEHQLYQCSRPGGSLAHGYTRHDQTLLDRFRSGHIKTLKYSEGCKSFEMCTNCSSEPATPAHILECLGLTMQDLVDVPLLVLYFLKVYAVMDLGWGFRKIENYIDDFKLLLFSIHNLPTTLDTDETEMDVDVIAQKPQNVSPLNGSDASLFSIPDLRHE
ncbi:uncharacterized protein TNCV_232681 [Trichonephila clavipes]|nr:uncharacterized protein TNCV_232681 [Trichonephila clavipes]